jgi:GH35 family endo-1,4-beta-xylanase
MNQKIESILSKIKIAENERDDLKLRQREVSQLTSKNQIELTRLSAELEEAQKEMPPEILFEPEVSDHALVRYMERILGLDIKEFKGRLLDEETKKAIQFAKSGKLKKDGHTLVFQDGVVVTITSDEDEVPKKKKKKHYAPLK